MKKILLVCLVLACAVSLMAQDVTKPAKYIFTYHVILAESKAATYPGLIAQFRHAADAIKADTSWLGASHVTGDLRATVYVMPLENVASVEKALASLDKITAEAAAKNSAFVAETAASELEPHSVLAKYRDDLSYEPAKVPGPQAKYWEVTLLVLNPGQRTNFSDLVKEEIELLKKGGVDEHFQTYEVIAGLHIPGSAYYVVTPMKSLAEMDVDNSEKMKAVFTPIVRHHFESVIGKMVASISTDLLMVRPELSRPPQAFLAANPDFWTVKEPAPLAAKAKKAKKTPVDAGH